jgi:hypothetical protein
MEPDMKSLPYYHSYRVMGTMFVPSFAIILLSILGIDYHKSKVDRLGALAVAGNGLAVGIAFFKLRGILVRFTEQQIDRKTLGEIWAGVTLMACLALVACISAVGLH